MIGIGNDLRGDDGAGRAVVEDLAGRDLPGVRAIWSHQLVPELAEPIAAARCVVFVDCALPGHADGSGAERSGAERSGAERSGVDLCRIAPGDPAFGGHQAGPQSLLGLAQLAGLPVPPAYLLSLPAHDLGLGDQLSGPAGEAVAVAVGMILRLADAPLDPDPLDPDPLDPDPLDAGPLDPDPHGVAPGADRAGDGASWCP